MITITKPTYKCEHCRKLYQIESACITHEPKCTKNPENIRACAKCGNCQKVDIMLHYDGEGLYGYVEGEREVSVLKCTKLNHFLIPPVSEHRGNGYLAEDMDGGELENKYMPLECDSFNEITE